MFEDANHLCYATYPTGIRSSAKPTALILPHTLTEPKHILKHAKNVQFGKLDET